MSFTNLANPHRFQKLACVLIPIVAIASIHVQFTWLSFGDYAVMVAAALGTLVWRHPLADIAGKRTLRILAAANGEMR